MLFRFPGRRRNRNDALLRGRRRNHRDDPPIQPTPRARGVAPASWATQPTAAFPQPGRVGWLTPAQTWRANGGRW